MLSPAGYDSSNSVGAPVDSSDDQSSDLETLRQELAQLVGDVGRIIEARAAQAKQVAVVGVEVGLDASRNTIRAYPVTSIAVATIVGASLAIMLTTPSRRPSLSARLGHMMPDVTRSDLNDMARQWQRSASQAAQGSGLASAFERVVESVSSIDPKSSFMPAMEKAGAWLNSLRSSMGGK